MTFWKIIIINSKQMVVEQSQCRYLIKMELKMMK